MEAGRRLTVDEAWRWRRRSRVEVLNRSRVEAARKRKGEEAWR